MHRNPQHSEARTCIAIPNTRPSSCITNHDPDTVSSDRPILAAALAGKLMYISWYVDANRGIERWTDGEWTGHGHLLRLLRAVGLHPRVEHIAREDFPARWDRGEVSRKLPELIAADTWSGLVRELERGARLVQVHSERLCWMTEAASCDDFKGRQFFLVADSPHKTATSRAIDELLRPGPENRLPGPELAESAGRNEAARIASSAVIAYISGDPRGLKSVASASSPQLTRCLQPPGWRDLMVNTGEVELRGNEAVAFARVEMRFHGRTTIGADPVVVVLRKEGRHWKAFSVGNDVFCVRALPDLCRLSLRQKSDPLPLTTPRLLSPDDGGPIGQGGRSFAWEVPAGGEPLAAQVCEVLLDDKGASWPSSRVKVYAGEPLVRSSPVSEPALTGVTSDEMRWCVWAIGADGRISPSDVRRYCFARSEP
jgi:hypothetical protein